MAPLAHFNGTSRLDIDDIVWQKEYFNVPKAKKWAPMFDLIALD